MRYAAFLRAVNVAGNVLPMAALKAMLQDGLGFDGVRTYLQSGNAVFETSKRKTAVLEDELQHETQARLDVRTEYFVRDTAELGAIIEGNPFEREGCEEPSKLVVFVLKRAPERERVVALRSWIAGPELVEAGARHLYISYPEGQGSSKLVNSVVERILQIRGTARNWNTICKLHDALAGG